MESLLMLTKFFPYGTEEAFIENEIVVLSKHFNKIVIIACEVPTNVTQVRKIPDNVICYKVTSKNKKIQSFSDSVGGLKGLVTPNSEMKKEFHLCKNILHKLFLCYFEKKSNRVFETIQQKGFLDNFKEERFILYSYWLFITARVGTKIQEEYANQIKYSFSRAHRYDLYADRNALSYLPYRELFLRSYTNICPCSDNGSKYLKARYPQYSEKIITSLLGTLDKGLNKCSSDGIFRIVSCSRLEDVKRIDRIVKALRLLESVNVQIEWTHIGSGRNYEKLKKLVSKELKHVKANLLGKLPNNKVLEFYRNNSVDLFVNVSSSEGLPVSIMEAISFSIPVIATDVGGTSEIIMNDETGQLISSDFKDEDLAEMIHAIIQSRATEKYNYMRSTARRVWEEQFQAINNYEKLCDMVDTHIDERISNEYKK